MTQFVFDAIGTYWTIDISEEITEQKETELYARIMERISVFDKDYSRFRKDSLVTRMSEKTGVYTLPPDARDMFAMYRRMYDITGGLFTPLIGQVLVDAGYDASYSLVQKKELEKPLSWDDAFTYNHPHIDIKIPTLLDFGAAGKGYLIDIVGGVIEEEGIASYCIDAGGDMLYRNVQDVPLRVGLEHPDDTEQVIGVALICNQGLCGSAGNRRVWGDFHHVINPDTLISPRHIKALWVIADTTLLADALTTALFFASPEILSAHFSFEYCILFSDNSLEKSSGFNAEIFS